MKIFIQSPGIQDSYYRPKFRQLGIYGLSLVKVNGNNYM